MQHTSLPYINNVEFCVVTYFEHTEKIIIFYMFQRERGWEYNILYKFFFICERFSAYMECGVWGWVWAFFRYESLLGNTHCERLNPTNGAHVGFFSRYLWSYVNILVSCIVLYSSETVKFTFRQRKKSLFVDMSCVCVRVVCVSRL